MAGDVTLLSMFLVGLLGAPHCLGMCGGIVGALSLGARSTVADSRPATTIFLLAYNGGRIASYTLAGAIAGYFSGHLLRIAAPHQVQVAAAVFQGLFMVALGLYIAGWWPGLALLERAGGHLWRRIEPLGRRFLPIDRFGKALAAGLVWGWLPCGLVYAALAWALVAGDALRGASLMLAFGLGTVPVMFGAGAAAHFVGRVVRNREVRSIAGAFVILLGLYTLSSVLAAR
jgi:uncharacterized protein